MLTTAVEGLLPLQGGKQDVVFSSALYGSANAIAITSDRPMVASIYLPYRFVEPLENRCSVQVFGTLNFPFEILNLVFLDDRYLVQR